VDYTEFEAVVMNQVTSSQGSGDRNDPSSYGCAAP
jgi:hypothetical protein